MTTTREHLMQIWGLEQHADTHAAYSEDLKKDHPNCGTPDCCGECDTAEDEVTEGPARDRLLKQMDKASGRTQADREADAKKAAERRKTADKDLADFRKKHGMSS